MKILFSFLPKPQQQSELIENFPQVDFLFQKPFSSEELTTADVLVTYGEDLKASHVEAASRLKWIMVASAGLEKMPMKEIEARNIIVTNVRGIHKTPMMESIIAHILSIKKSLPTVRENQRNGVWSKNVKSSELFGSTAVILGPGAIGGEVGRMLQAFGVHTIGCNRSGKSAEYMDQMVSFSELKNVLPSADLVISVLPSTPETKHLLTYEHFQCMKRTAIFMNYGRGDLIKEEELHRALKEELVAYAVLDVFEQEPLKEGHAFWEMTNVIVSPHISSHSSKYVERALAIFSQNLDVWLKGEKQMINLIDVKRGY